MRRKDKEVSDAKQIEDFLAKAPVVRIGLLDGGLPYIVPLNFIYIGGTIYFHSAKNSRKLELMRQNPQVAFELDEYLGILTHGTPCRTTSRYFSVMGRADAFFITDGEQKRELLLKLTKKYVEDLVVLDMPNIEAVELVALRVTEIVAKRSPATEE